jgi:polyisoprenoid-binding protein YceI
MTRLKLFVLAASLLAAPAVAADWTVDPAKSTLSFASSQAGETFTGHFTRYTATISFDPAKPEAAHVLVLVDTKSAVTGDSQRDAFLPQPDWFDTAKFADAKFEATGFTPKGGDAYETAGTLTLKGVSQKITLPFKLTLAGGTAHAVGGVTLNRMSFGVGQGQFTTPDWVPFEVAVTLDLTAAAAPGD